MHNFDCLSIAYVWLSVFPHTHKHMRALSARCRYCKSSKHYRHRIGSLTFVQFVRVIEIDKGEREIARIDLRDLEQGWWHLSGVRLICRRQKGWRWEWDGPAIKYAWGNLNWIPVQCNCRIPAGTFRFGWALCALVASIAYLMSLAVSGCCRCPSFPFLLGTYVYKW